MTAAAPFEIPDGFSPPGEPRSPFTIAQPVSWSELDAYGHVNHAVYLRWIENSRFHYFELTGVSAHHAVASEGPILARLGIEYLAPVGFPDTLLVSTRVTRIGRSSLTTDFAVWSTHTRCLCARGDGVIVMVDYKADRKSVPVPEPIRAAIRALEPELLETPA